MNVWRLITHHEDKDAALFWTRQNGRIAFGWGNIGDIRIRNYESKEEIAAAIKVTYPQLRNSGSGGISLWDFYSNMVLGDLVVLSASKPRELVVEVQGQYEWQEQAPLEGDYYHQRGVLIRRDLDPEKDIWDKAGRSAPFQNVHCTLIRAERSLNEEDI